jgi:HSP20 family protein
MQEAAMRYRRLDYRYTMIVTTGLRPFGEWRAERFEVRLAEPHWRPETDVYETPAAVTVTVELAAVDQEGLEILLFEDALVIEGQRRFLCEEGGVYRAAEIRQGPFRVAVALPEPVDPDGIDARYEQGLLRVRLPKVGGR